MPNAYASIADVKAGLPDGFRAATTKYDSLIMRLASDVSRAIDNWCNRQFYPQAVTLYFNGTGGRDLWVPDLAAITTVSYSDDDGETYTALTADDYLATVAGDVNALGSYNLLRVSALSDTLSAWPAGERSVKIVGVKGCSDWRDQAWESTGDTVENNPLASGGTSVTVNDADGADAWGLTPRFSGGQVLRIGSEYLETTAEIDTAANTLTVLRGRNGSTAAQHAQNTAIDIWRAPENIRRACVIQVVRQMERGFNAFGDQRGPAGDVPQASFGRQWDPEVLALMSPYRHRVLA